MCVSLCITALCSLTHRQLCIECGSPFKMSWQDCALNCPFIESLLVWGPLCLSFLFSLFHSSLFPPLFHSLHPSVPLSIPPLRLPPVSGTSAPGVCGQFVAEWLSNERLGRCLEPLRSGARCLLFPRLWVPSSLSVLCLPSSEPSAADGLSPSGRLTRSTADPLVQGLL